MVVLNVIRMSNWQRSLDFKPGHTTTLGLDPSMTSTGYAVIRGGNLVAAGKIVTKPSQPEPERLLVIFSEVVSLIREHDVDHVAIEEFAAFYRNRSRSVDPAVLASVPALTAVATGRRRRGKHDRDSIDPRSMFLMKAAQTVTQVAALLAGCSVFLYKVPEWKGGQKVSKEVIIERARLLYGVTTRDNNVTDAIMIAHHHITHGRLRLDRGYTASVSDLADVLKLFQIDPRSVAQEVA